MVNTIVEPTVDTRVTVHTIAEPTVDTRVMVNTIAEPTVGIRVTVHTIVKTNWLIEGLFYEWIINFNLR